MLIPQTVFGQSEKLGIVQYTAPKGWTKTPKENVVVFSEVDQAASRFCIITLYGATPGTGKPESDFAREWIYLPAPRLYDQIIPLPGDRKSVV